MPRVRVEDYEDFENDDEFNIDDDEPRNQRGQRVLPKHPPRQDRDWEETRKALIQRRAGRDRD